MCSPVPHFAQIRRPVGRIRWLVAKDFAAMDCKVDTAYRGFGRVGIREGELADADTSVVAFDELAVAIAGLRLAYSVARHSRRRELPAGGGFWRALSDVGRSAPKLPESVTNGASFKLELYDQRSALSPPQKAKPQTCAGLSPLRNVRAKRA